MKMPDLATVDSDITVVRWLVEGGQSVRRGEPLLEVETDKALMEAEAIATGTLKAVRAQPGDAVAAGEVIAVIEVEGVAPAIAASQPVEPPAPVSAASPPPSPSGAPRGCHRRDANATERGGMFARNRRERASGQDAHATGAKQAIPLDAVQRTVARRMTESKQTIPHFYVQTSANAEPMRARREAAAPQKIVWDAFFVHAVGRALQRFERMMLRFENDRLVPHAPDVIGVAVDVDGDLFVVPIADAAVKTPTQISAEIVALVERLQRGDPEARRLRPACLTVTNLGMTGVESFTAVINPPESAVLAVGRIAPCAVVKDGQIVVEHRVTLTLSVDHRVVSGKYAADFLSAIAQELASL